MTTTKACENGKHETCGGAHWPTSDSTLQKCSCDCHTADIRAKAKRGTDGCPPSIPCPTCEKARANRHAGFYVWMVCPNGNEVRSW